MKLFSPNRCEVISPFTMPLIIPVSFFSIPVWNNGFPFVLKLHAFVVFWYNCIVSAMVVEIKINEISTRI